jgi:hypothetical protein
VKLNVFLVILGVAWYFGDIFRLFKWVLEDFESRCGMFNYDAYIKNNWYMYVYFRFKNFHCVNQLRTLPTSRNFGNM